MPLLPIYQQKLPQKFLKISQGAQFICFTFRRFRVKCLIKFFRAKLFVVKIKYESIAPRRMDFQMALFILFLYSCVISLYIIHVIITIVYSPFMVLSLAIQSFKMILLQGFITIEHHLTRFCFRVLPMLQILATLPRRLMMKLVSTLFHNLFFFSPYDLLTIQLVIRNNLLRKQDNSKKTTPDDPWREDTKESCNIKNKIKDTKMIQRFLFFKRNLYYF